MPGGSKIKVGLIGCGNVALNFLGVPDNPGAQNYSPGWRHDPLQAGGGVLMDMIHAIYLAEFLADGQIEAVSAVIGNLGEPDFVEYIALVQLTFERAYATGPFSNLDSFTLINGQGRQEFQPREDKKSGDNFLAIHQDFAGAVKNDRPPRAPAGQARSVWFRRIGERRRRVLACKVAVGAVLI